MKKYIRKADIILFIVLVVTGLAVTAVLGMSHADGDTVAIESHGKLYGTYSLYEDRTLTIGEGDEYNIVEIAGGVVSVTEASCKNQVCVRHGEISKAGESIVCLPNRLVVRIEGKEKGGGYDSVTS